ncbi:hypothetical protein HDK77DRAFT_122935 [Phyllosticta capitalensis]
MSSLNAPRLFEREDEITEAQENTFRWLLEPPPERNSEFVDFLQGNESMFWISGKTGSGKSTLMKFLFDHPALRENLSAWSGGETYATASFFFHRQGLSLQKSLEGLLRSLLYQLLEQSERLPGLLGHLERRNKRSESWTLKELETAFTNCMRDTPRVFLCIDGLDEYTPAAKTTTSSNSAEDRDKDRIQIAKYVCRLTQSNRLLKICISSRPYPEFQRKFENTPGLQLHELTKDDIRAYIDSHFEDEDITDLHWQHLTSSDEDNDMLYEYPGKCGSAKEILRDRIAESSSGIFLWVALVVRRVVDQILRVDSTLIRMVRQIYACEPTYHGELFNLFDQLWDEIDEKYQEEALVYIRVLQRTWSPPRPSHRIILACGAHPSIAEQWLSTREFPEIFGELRTISLDMLEARAHDRIRFCCGQFVERTPSDSDREYWLGVQFSLRIPHFSVHEYFSSNHFFERNRPSLQDSHAKADLLVASGCIMALWNPQHLEYDWPKTLAGLGNPMDIHKHALIHVAIIITLGKDTVAEIFARGETTNLGDHLLEAASAPRLLFWACNTPGNLFHDHMPRGNVLRELCLFLTKPNLFISEQSRPLTERLFELFIVFPDEDYMEMYQWAWGHCNLRKDLEKEYHGLNTFGYCLMTLMFFHLFKLRSFDHQVEPTAGIFQDFVMDLIQEGATCWTVIEVHPMLEKKWMKHVPLWALGRYLDELHFRKSQIDAALQEGRVIPVLQIIEWVFGRNSKAWKLLNNGKAPLEEEDSAEEEGPDCPLRMIDRDLGLDL